MTMLCLSLGLALLPVVTLAAPAATAPADGAPGILVLGDSLSAAYGLAPSQGWVALLQKKLDAEGQRWRVTNASISGETTAGGASRIGAELARHRPRVVVIALGANDGLRGLPPTQTRRNLDAMIRASQQAGARVLLVGMRLPPNLGPQYTQAFEAIFRELATQREVPLLPFLLEPIARDRRNFQDDNLHPVAEAQPALREHVYAALSPLLK
jgi:acyl-CoA thioesterase-1